MQKIPEGSCLLHLTLSLITSLEQHAQHCCYPGLGWRKSEIYPGNPGFEAGIHLGWGKNTLMPTSATRSNLSVAFVPPDMLWEVAGHLRNQRNPTGRPCNPNSDTQTVTQAPGRPEDPGDMKQQQCCVLILYIFRSTCSICSEYSCWLLSSLTPGIHIDVCTQSTVSFYGLMSSW